jgi:hypothetical protein
VSFVLLGMLSGFLLAVLLAAAGRARRLFPSGQPDTVDDEEHGTRQPVSA